METIAELGAGGGTPVRPSRILAADTTIRRDPAGNIYARSPHILAAYPVRLTDRLDEWADRVPDRVFLAQRCAGADALGQWRTVSYGETRQRVRRIAQSLIERGLSSDRPIVLLSGNSIEHALMALAAMYAGVPYAPVAPAYSLLARDYTTLRSLWGSMRPGLAFAADGRQFERPLASVIGGDTEIVTCSSPETMRATPFTALEERPSTTAVDDAHARVGPATVAKILFTSGSTGRPKGVINTQRMLCANQEQIRTAMPLLGDDPPVLCDWLPWNHTFGGNHNFGIVLYNGGTLYLDDGKPTPADFHTTIVNLREIATTAYFNVPKGFEMLLPALAADAGFRRHFFSRVRMLFYAAAGLRQQIADEFEAFALDARGERIPWVTGLGATETGPLALCTGARMSTTASVGVPVPGVELKAVPIGPTLEARVRGPNITPGYWRDAELTRAAFDDEGFYKLGDAIGFADPANASAGFVFEGRIAEDFKLSTGTWIRVGPLRARLLTHFGDLIDDVVVTGPGRDFVGALLFPNVRAARTLCGDDGTRTVRGVLEDEAVMDRVGRLLEEFAGMYPGSSTRVCGAALLEEAASLDAQEITAKGSLNQKAVLAHRQAIVEQIYGAPGSVRVIRLASTPGEGS